MASIQGYDGFVAMGRTVTLGLATEKNQLHKGEENPMKKLNTLIWKLRIIKDTRGQDLIEYALMAGFIAVAAGAIVPGVASSIQTIFSSIKTKLDESASAAS